MIYTLHMNPEFGPRKEEQVPQLLARVTFSRHEETAYTGVGRDITAEGIARAQEKGRKIVQEKGAPALIGHSPKERAKGTAESIEEGAREVAGDSTKTLGGYEFRDCVALIFATKRFKGNL